MTSGPDGIRTLASEEMRGTRYGKIYENGIGELSLFGPIVPRSSMMTMSGATSITQFTSDFLTMMQSPNVNGLVIRIDSPGGDVRGIGDAAGAINAAMRIIDKPVKVFAEGFMASAAYYIGSAVGAKNIISSEMALVGSIGVVLTAMKAEKDRVEIVSSQSPHKRPDVGTKEGRTVLQMQVDDLAEIFVRDVAKYRGVTEEKVLAEYGQGQCFVGPRAMAQGLVDGIGTLGSVVEDMAASISKGTSGSRTKAHDTTSVASLLQFTGEDNTMALKDILGRFRASNESLVEATDNGEQGHEDATAVGATSDDTPAVATEAPISPEAPIAAPANVAVDAVAVAQAQKPSREELEERFSDGAELFASQMVTDSRVFPAFAAHAASDLLTAKLDDAVIGGTVKFVDVEGQLAEGTREAAVRARYEAMPRHNMTQKSVKGVKDGSIEAQVLAETDKVTTDAPMSPERKAELLASSSIGQAVLNNAR